jgi:glycosyltransferase involved in cell wall biosynthesis
LGIADRVLFRGETGPRDLAALYQQSDVLVLPSSTEALPSVITEAMLCGLPFVASAVGGIPEQANGFGVVLEDRSAESIAAALTNLFDNYGHFQESGEAMSRYARQKYSISTMVNQHLELYAQLKGTRPRRLATKFAVQRGIARLASHFMGTSGPARSAEVSATKVA